jgi:tetratricopeptide (TPR) repeat protein
MEVFEMKIRRKALVVILALTVTLSGCMNKKDNNNYIGKGMEDIEANDYDSAIAEFDYALTDNVEVFQAYRGLGIAYLGKGDYPNAIVNFGNALSQKQAKNKNVRKDLLYYKASAQYKNAEYSKAIETYQLILDIDKEADAYYLRGMAYLANQQLDAANADFNQAVSMKADNYSLYVDIYNQYTKANMEEEGILYLQKALAIQADDGENSYEIGRIYYYLKDYENARSSFNKAADAGNKEALLFLGKVHYELEDIDNGIAIYQKYLAEAAQDARAYNGLALGKIMKKDYDGALGNIQTGLSMDAGDEKQSLLFNEIAAYEGKHDFATAREKAKAYVKLYPNDLNGKREYEFLQTR